MKRGKRRRRRQTLERSAQLSRLSLVQDKRDHNEVLIVEALERYGCQVIRAIPLVEGFPDLIVQKFGVTMFLEVKNPHSRYGKYGLNQMQEKFHRWWGGPVGSAYTAQEAVDFVADVLQKYDLA